MQRLNAGMPHTMEHREITATHLSGIWTDAGEIVLAGRVRPDPGEGGVRIRLAYANHRARWITAGLRPGGTFSYKENAPDDALVVFIVALFEGNEHWLESRSPEHKVTAPMSTRELE